MRLQAGLRAAAAAPVRLVRRRRLPPLIQLCPWAQSRAAPDSKRPWMQVLDAEGEGCGASVPGCLLCLS